MPLTKPTLVTTKPCKNSSTTIRSTPQSRWQAITWPYPHKSRQWSPDAGPPSESLPPNQLSATVPFGVRPQSAVSENQYRNDLPPKPFTGVRQVLPDGCSKSSTTGAEPLLALNGELAGPVIGVCGVQLLDASHAAELHDEPSRSGDRS